MLKFKNILESYENENWGFRDPEFNDESIFMDLLSTHNEFSLLRDKKSNLMYITNTEGIPYDYEQSDYFYEDDYEGFNDDNAKMTNESIELFTQHEIKSGYVMQDVDDYLNFNSNKVVLLLTKENKTLVYANFLDLIKTFLYGQTK
jgi:hypothetical protein